MTLDIKALRAQVWRNWAAAFYLNPPDEPVVYGSFARPVEYVWARDLIDVARLYHTEGRLSSTRPWTYVVVDRPLSVETAKAYELERIV